ncbi:ABC transporter permease [Salinicoccus albus]|uniref:ABC transporter permease n=1 Tax=Salinicoccus albus TaxID=418756 RepID=UPI00036BB9E9|nr:ABC transporter permease subunit [Salinicoccus albus]
MKRLFKYGLYTIILLFLLLFITFPVVVLVTKSISAGWTFPHLFPQFFTLRGWELLKSNPEIVEAIYTTVIIAVSVVMLNIIFALPVAKGISHYHFRGKTVLETIFLLPILVPSLAIAMGLHLTMIRLGLSDKLIGVILIHMLPTLPYSIRMFKAGFDQLGIKWEEQARTIGVKRLRVFWTVTFPMLAPNIRSVALLSYVISLSQYALTAIIGGGVVTTLPMIYYPFFNSADQMVIAAFSIVFAILPILFLMVLEVFMKIYVHIVKR